MIDSVRNALRSGNKQGMKMKELSELLGQKQAVISEIIFELIKEGSVIRSEVTIEGAYLYSLVNYENWAENLKPVEKPVVTAPVPERLQHSIDYMFKFENRKTFENKMRDVVYSCSILETAIRELSEFMNTLQKIEELE
jgi:hypothetical protein